MASPTKRMTTHAYDEVYARWSRDPEGFWARAADRIHWNSPWERVLDDSRAPFVQWFPGATVNTCYNAVDRHVEAGRGAQAALVWDSAMTGVREVYSYHDLKERVAELAGALAGLGVAKGDRVLLYLPMVPEAVFAMLAVARLGAIHSVVFGGFAANELAVRIDEARPKVVLSASCGLEPGRVIEYKPLLDRAIELASHRPEHCVILQRPQVEAPLVPDRDRDWRDLVDGAAPHACVPVESTDPLYVLYTSGTTGVPKGVVRDNGGHLVALEWSIENIYGMRPGDVFWAASDVGWVVGHSFIVYAPLVHGCTTVLYEGKPVGTPDAGAFWRVIAEHRVNCLFTAPTAFRAIKREDPDGRMLERYDLSCLRTLFLAGERLDTDTLRWAERKLHVPVIDHWWQTETGWPMVANPVGIGLLPVKPGSPTKPMPGWSVRVVDEAGAELPAGQMGAIVCEQPLPPGSLSTLWRDDDRFVENFARFPGRYETGDAGYFDEDGYLFVMGRTDDIINVAGHRLSTGAMEEVVAGHPDVAECAVIGVDDSLKGQIPLGLLVLKAGSRKEPIEVVREVVRRVRERIGPVACFKKAVVVNRLPKTRSGKILRSTIQKIADRRPYRIPATIDDPAILDEIADDLRDAGYAGSERE